MMDAKLNTSGVVMPTSNLPKYICLSSMGELKSGSIVPRSFSPTKDSSATTSVKDRGKKPITSTTNGIRLSRMSPPPNLFMKLTAWRVVSSAINGNKVTNRNIGTTMRQSRNWSVNSRCATIQIDERLCRIRQPLCLCHRLEVDLLKPSRHFLKRNQRGIARG